MGEKKNHYRLHGLRAWRGGGPFNPIVVFFAVLTTTLLATSLYITNAWPPEKNRGKPATVSTTEPSVVLSYVNKVAASSGHRPTEKTDHKPPPTSTAPPVVMSHVNKVASASGQRPPEKTDHKRSPTSTAPPVVLSHVNKAANAAEAPTQPSCDVFDGRWILDNTTHPLYSGDRCPYITDDFACDRWGRKNTRYQQWRWQPKRCDLPSFNATKLLEKLRGKKIVFVGDSLNRNQWISMACLLHSHIAQPPQESKETHSLISFKAEEYNVSVDFYWSPLLVESNCDHPWNHRGIKEKVIRAGEDAMEKHARHWNDADVLVFNSYLWWPETGMKATYGSLEDPEKKTLEIGQTEGFRLALEAWSKWLEINWAPPKQIYYMSFSPTHFLGEGWGSPIIGGSCYSEEEPINGGEGYSETDEAMKKMVAEAVEALRRRKGVDVHLLNVTHLSKLRKDGHPSIFRNFWDNIANERKKNPSGYSDCAHWCLPGVPDVWNELLYYFILRSHH